MNQVQQDLTDVGGERLIAIVRDPEGHIIGTQRRDDRSGRPCPKAGAE